MKQRAMLILALCCSLFTLPEGFSQVIIPARRHGAGGPVALIGLQNVSGFGDGCENHLGFFRVDSIAYEGVSDVVGGIRVRPISGPNGTPNPNQPPDLIRIDTSKMDEADRSWVPSLVKEGSRLLIAFSRCGNGGYDFARDIYKANFLNW